MKYGKLILEKCDFVMIKRYRQLNRTYADYAHKNTLDILDSNMASARILDAAQIPGDIVQLYSSLTVSCIGQWRPSFKLVPPSEEHVKNGRISVVSTLGASIIGLSEDDFVKFGLPGNMLGLKIEEVVPCRKKEAITIS